MTSDDSISFGAWTGDADSGRTLIDERDGSGGWIGCQIGDADFRTTFLLLVITGRAAAAGSPTIMAARATSLTSME